MRVIVWGINYAPEITGIAPHNVALCEFLKKQGADVERAPFVFHVQDLQPDAAVGLGMLRAGWFTRVLYGLEAFAYRRAARVSGISEEILEAFRRKGVPEKKLILFPNGVAIPQRSQ